MAAMDAAQALEVIAIKETGNNELELERQSCPSFVAVIEEK
jgi:hypothetical protein